VRIEPQRCCRERPITKANLARLNDPGKVIICHILPQQFERRSGWLECQNANFAEVLQAVRNGDCVASDVCPDIDEEHFAPSRQMPAEKG